MTQLFHRIVESAWFQNFILAMILLAAVLVGIETYPYMIDRYGEILHFLDSLVLWVFVAEAVLKMAQHGRKWYRYFLDPWNIFDFTIVVVCFLPMDSHFAAVLRLARVLRTLRLVTVVPRLQLLVGAMLHSIPSMFWVGVLLSLLFYIYAVMGVFLWRENDPAHFGNLQLSLLSLFRVVTLEDWTDIMYIQMFGTNVYPYDTPLDEHEAGQHASPIVGAIYFVSFVLLGTMIMLNLFIGVIIQSMSDAQAAREQAERLEHQQKLGHLTLGDDLRKVEHQIEQLQESLLHVRERAERDAPDV